MIQLPLVKARIPVAKAKDRLFKADPENAPNKDLREEMFQLEKEGEWIVQRVPEPYTEVMTKYGRTKKIPVEKTWRKRRNRPRGRGSQSPLWHHPISSARQRAWRPEALLVSCLRTLFFSQKP